MSPVRVQRRRTKGWRMPEGAVYVGRPSKWGNPAKVQPTDEGWEIIIDYPDGTRTFFNAEHFGKNEKWEANNRAVFHFKDMFTEAGQEAARDELRGKDLVCWCPLDQPCHADVLLELANA